MNRFTLFTSLPLLLLTLLMAPDRSRADTIPPGTDIADAFGIKVSEYGFEFLSMVAPDFVPSEFPVDDTSSSFECAGSDVTMTIAGLVMYIEVTSAEIIPRDGFLDIYMDAIISSNQAVMYLEGGCLLGMIPLDDTCIIEIPPTDTEMHTTISFYLDPLTYTLSAIVGDIEVGVAHIDNVLSDCTLSNIVEILGYMGIDIIDYLIGMYIDQINSELKAEIENSLNEALQSLNVNEEFEVEEATLQVVLNPSGFTLDPSGMLIFMGGHIIASAGENCVDSGEGSYYTDNPPPTFGETIPGTSSLYHFAATLSDDIANQGIFALWDGGVLCYSLTEASGTEITSFYLSMLCSGFSDLFDGTQPAVFEVVPYEVPIVSFDGPDQITVSIDGMNFEPYSVVAERFARIFSMKISGDLGLNLIYEDGFIYFEMDPVSENLSFAVEYNELMPECDADLEEKFPLLIDLFLPNLQELIPPIEVPLTAGISIASAEVISPDGSGGDFLSLYGELDYDPEAGGGGCGADGGGCQSSSQSCSGEGGSSCSIRGGGQAPLLSFLPLLIYMVILRRKGVE